jgi:PPOX class probable F420-dependent enzyme
MEWKEALPLLQDNHTGIAISVSPKGRAQATVVSTAVLDGKVGFASRGYTVKVKNIQRSGRATITVIKLDTRRYVTVEGPASIEPWQDTPAHLKRLKELYSAMGRAPKGSDEEFAKQMRSEERNIVLITPERLYGSLRSGA